MSRCTRKGQGNGKNSWNIVYLFIYLFTYRQWMNPYLATYDYLKSIIENYFKNIP